jgi:HD-like signal output (HDOD) protein
MTIKKTTQAQAELLAGFIPFDSCSADDLVVLADHAWLDEVERGHVLVQAGSSDEWDYYLVEGTLKLVAEDGKESFLMGGRTAARAPLAHLQPRHYTISAMTPVRYLRVETALLKNLDSSGGSEGHSFEEPTDIREITDNPLYVEIYDDLMHDRLVMPSLPKVALRIRRMIEEEDVSVPQLAKVINIDLAISAKLVKAANGALYHGQPQLNTCSRAVARLGLNTTKHLVLGFVMRNLFQEKIRTKLIRHLAKELWQHSVEVAAISMALARVTPGLDGEEALLMGLLHDVGALVILSYADNYPEFSAEREVLIGVVDQLKGKIGAAVLEEWQFPEPFIVVAREAENWSREHDGPADYCDVVQVAQLHDVFGTAWAGNYPALTDVPAFTRLADGHLTPELSMEVLDSAREQMQDIRQLLMS